MGLSCQRVEQETDGKEVNAKERRGDKAPGASKHQLEEEFSHLNIILWCAGRLEFIYVISAGVDKGKSPHRYVRYEEG